MLLVTAAARVLLGVLRLRLRLRPGLFRVRRLRMRLLRLLRVVLLVRLLSLTLGLWLSLLLRALLRLLLRLLLSVLLSLLLGLLLRPLLSLLFSLLLPANRFLMLLHRCLILLGTCTAAMLHARLRHVLRTPRV